MVLNTPGKFSNKSGSACMLSHSVMPDSLWTHGVHSPLSVHGILQARILERVAIPCFRGSSWPRHRTVSPALAGRFYTVWTTREAQVWKSLKQIRMNLQVVRVLDMSERTSGRMSLKYVGDCLKHVRKCGKVLRIGLKSIRKYLNLVRTSSNVSGSLPHIKR